MLSEKVTFTNIKFDMCSLKTTSQIKHFKNPTILNTLDVIAALDLRLSAMLFHDSPELPMFSLSENITL